MPLRLCNSERHSYYVMLLLVKFGHEYVQNLMDLSKTFSVVHDFKLRSFCLFLKEF